MDPHPGRRWSDLSERMITIADEISRDFVPRKRLAELLGRPGRRGMGGDRDVHDASALMRQNDEHEQQAIRDGGNDEEVGCHDLLDMIREKYPPRLGRWSSVSGHVLGDRGLADVYAELQEFAVDSWGAPQQVGLRHLRINKRTS
jgi:hypothetical protein